MDAPTGAWFWGAWILGGVVAESIALWGKRHRHDTLSKNIQWAVLRGPVWRRATLAGWGVFSAWFAWHIWG